MTIWKNASFQTKLLVLFFFLSSIPALLIGTIAYQKSSDILHNQTKLDLDAILAQLNTSIERQINDFDRFSILPYFMPETFNYLNKPYISQDQWGTAEINAQKTMIRLMSAYPSINSSINGLMVYGMNGAINGYRVNGDFAINLNENVKDDSWYKEVLAQQGGIVITGVNEIKQFTGTPFKAIIASRLLLDDNYRPIAVIAIFISPDFIEKLVDSLQLHNVQVSVLDSEKNLIYGSDLKLSEQLRLFGSDHKKGVWETDVAEDTGRKTFSGVSLKGKYLGWKIYMGVNRDDMLKGSRSIRNFTIVVIIVLAFLSAAISWLLARGLSKPVFRLIRSMREVERGKFSAPISFEREDEIGQLERSYGKMVNRLDELVSSIEEKERQKRHAELNALRARIQPHFLFNTLNSIRMLAILQQSPQIAKLIQSLNKLLYANMKLDSEVSLEDEIRLLKVYASLMDLRYTNVFEIVWLIPEQIQNAAIPHMLLQPLLENAIFHGAKGLERKLNIVVQARLVDKDRNLIIEIKDNGSGFPESILELFNDRSKDSAATNIGLRNVQDRIRLRFGIEYGMTLERLDGYTYVIIKIPFEIMGKETGRNVEFTGG